MRHATSRIGIGVGGFERNFELSSELRLAARILAGTVNTLQLKASRFQHHWCDTILARCIFALNLPIAPLRDLKLYFLRKTCVDTAFSRGYSALPIDTIVPSDGPLRHVFIIPRGFKPQSPTFGGLTVCSAGLPNAVIKAIIYVIAAEVQLAAGERNPFHSSPSLHNAEATLLMRAGVEWTEQRVKAEHLNVKDEYMPALSVAGAEAVMDHRGPDKAIAEEDAKSLNRICAILADIVGDGGQFAEPDWQAVASNEDMADETSWDLWTKDFSNYGWVNFATNV
ncbi:hypothetical protein S40293_03975 [Stachybotrys chartarum IBT 40293]|nr:hypothetical protein S40293_03975 [Stachybotrys chartarum IBT 40293]